LHHGSLGKLKFETVRLKLSLVKSLHDGLAKISLLQLSRRNIDGNAKPREAGLMPLFSLRAGHMQNPPAEWNNEPGLFRQQDEVGGRQQSQLRMFPANQRLSTNNISRFDIYLRLVINDKLFIIYSAAKLLH